MINFDLLKNPIIVAVIFAILTYLYLWWEEKNRRKANPKTKKRQINIITPLVVGGISWLIASNYFTKSIINTDNTIQQIAQNAKNTLPNIVGGKRQILVHNNGKIATEGSLGSASYHIISKKNVRLPPTDVFIDLAKF